MINGILDGADCGIILIYLCRDRPHGIRQVGPHIADRHGLVSLQQHVISDRYDLGAVFDAEASVVDGHGIAEPELLQRSDVLVFLCLPQGHEGYLALDEQLRQSIIKATNFSFVFRAKSSVFHKPSCYQVTRIPFMYVRGATYYDTCLEHGKRPCGWCKPKRSDEVEPLHVYPADMLMGDDFISKDELKRMWVDPAQAQWGATRKLTEREKVALKRHKSAAKERANKPESLSGQQAHDFMTLTQPGYAFWAQAGYSNFHLRNCKRLGGLSNLRGFARYSDATRAGLKPCRICKPTQKHDIMKSVPIYQKTRKTETVEDLDRMCDQLGWAHVYEEPEYRIETPAGKWKIITGTMPVDVFHINKVTQPDETNYHKQHRLFISMTDTIKYIRQHDESLIGEDSHD